MIPTPGRIVEYSLCEQDVARISQSRGVKPGLNSNTGNSVAPGDVFPMVIVRCWGTTDVSSVNGQVLLDGADTLWVTSVAQGDGERKFRAFPRV